MGPGAPPSTTDFPPHRHIAIRYWERRRILYNLALVPPSVLSYLLTAGVSRVGDDYAWHPYQILVLFLVSAFGANLCYTFAYALEFLFGSDAPSSNWLRFGRPIVFVSGLTFGMLLAALGGRNIALVEYSFR